ncbi:DUF4446 family protein [Nocardiopsis deserti]|uniref:DUF4446 family protein n=1 Tax=Nocardiopsis deserti TaxID=2605988 RepID=UPI001CC2631B|nr:DUF4446 family protein [Nocardiopsis deserti]
MFTTILALTGMLSGLGALALGWHALSRTRVISSESQALAQRASAVSASGVDPFAVRDVAVLHYDALEEMSGARSFSLALLNSEGDGVVVTSINGRTESRTYAKAVVGGDCDTLLSPEEHRVVRSARLGEGVGAAAGSSPTRAVSSAGVQPVPPPAARDEPGSPAGRDEERGAREGAEADVETGAVEVVEGGAGPKRRRDAPAAPTRTDAARQDVEAAHAAPSARKASATASAADDDREVSGVPPASPALSVAGEQAVASATGATSAPPAQASSAATFATGDDRNGPEAAAAARTAPPAGVVPPARTAPPAGTVPAASADSAATGDDREEREPRGLASVIRRTIERVGTDRRAPVEAVRSGVGAARPVVSANVTVRSGPSATAAGSAGTSATGTATAAEPRPGDPTGGKTGGDGAREADAPASEARR